MVPGDAKVPLGRLERVDVRNVWESEAGGFTPWLAQEENIALLGEAIGVDLEVEAQEKPVGPFRADILCRDTGSGNWVLIENQLERTDHTHLGQLLTYAAGLDAVTVVWVSPTFTEEHRAALDWLNKITGQRFNFFGLEIEAWRIGDSAIAPKFNLVSKPNAWIEEVTRTVQEPTGVKQLQLEYWTVFKNFVDSVSKTLKTQKPLPQNWTNFAIGRAGFTLSPSVNTTDKSVEVALVITDPQHKAFFDELQQQQGEIEKAIGFPLQWRERPKSHYIGLFRDQTDPANKEDWPTQHAWLLQTAEAFYRAFSQRIKGLTGQEQVLARAADTSQ